ncbi:MAG: hypothetical protein IPK17_35045 [Chloroflexi bacterium]|uniref:hypothetical protein n=1 Tax=Candidatus Flexifilum breve TaxID=3140694 RepID=UPI0031351BA3|nr:hypothetical protein [Chloroflexota bacterium]
MSKSNWHSDFRYRFPLTVYDSLGGGRDDEPVALALAFPIVRPHPTGLCLTDSTGTTIPLQIAQSTIGADGKLEAAMIHFLASVAPGAGSHTYYLYFSPDAHQPEAYTGIQQLPSALADGFRRLDTGRLCA